MSCVLSLPQKRSRVTLKESRSIGLEKLIHDNDGRLLDIIFDKGGGT